MTMTDNLAVRVLSVGIVVFSCSACGQPQGLVDGPIRISSDGREIVVALRKGEHSSIYRFPRGGGSGAALTRDGSDSDPALSTDGAMLAFVREDGQGRGDVWILDMKTGAESRLTTTESNERLPIFSRDGRRLWFGRAKTLRTTSTFGTRWVDWTVIERNLATDAERQVCDVVFRGVNALDISRDNRRLLLSVDQLESGRQVYEVELLTGAMKAVGEPGDTYAAYLEDAHEYALVRQAGVAGSQFVYEVFISEAGGQRWRRVTRTDSYNVSPAVVPGTRSLLFLSDPQRDGSYELMEVDISSSQTRRVPLVIR